MLMMALRHCSMCKLRLKMSICSQASPASNHFAQNLPDRFLCFEKEFLCLLKILRRFWSGLSLSMKRFHKS